MPGPSSTTSITTWLARRPLGNPGATGPAAAVARTVTWPPAGEWLDHVVDSVKTSALHLAVLIGWYRADVVDEVWLPLLRASR